MCNPAAVKSAAAQKAKAAEQTIMPAIIYICISLIIGLLGYNRKFGFWGYFFGSLVLTPVIGLILVLASDKKKSDISEEQ